MAGNLNSGRQPVKKEYAVIRYYEALLPKIFTEVRKNLESPNKENKRWAMEWLKTGVVKLLPQIQKIGGDPDNQTPIPVSILKGVTQNVSADHSNHQDTETPQTT